MLNFKIDEKTLLKEYNIGSLKPTKWEDFADVDDDLGSVPVNEDDPLGLEASAALHKLDVETRATTSLTSLTFDPTAYLTLAHPQATYVDLARGVEHLERVLHAREGAVRVLVEENFDRFVIVKGATEGLYEEMKNEILSEERDHATRPLFDYLRSGAQKGNQIFLPVLETAANKEELRKTLSVFERSKFFFNLPSFIMESISTGHYELALRDYKKGKYILENRPGQLLPISVSSAAASNTVPSAPAYARSQQQQMRVLNKVWASVERAMSELKRVLIAQLTDAGRSIEEHDKALETLLEIPADEDPLWLYFDTHHTRMMDALTAAYRSAAKEIDYVLQTPGLAESAEDTLRTELQSAVDRLYAKQTDAVIASSTAETAWNAIFELVKSVSEAISSSLPSFWRISKDLIDGKIKRTAVSAAAAKRSPTQCRTMAYDIVKLYISLISQLFVLSDMVVMNSAEKTGGKTNTTLPRLPKNSHSLCTAFHLQRIFNEVKECVNDVSALDISAEARNGLASLLDSVSWRFVDILTKEWIRDANIFYHLERWIASWDASSSSTRYLAQFVMYQTRIVTATYRIAAGGEGATNKSSRSKGVPQLLTSKITNAAFQSTHAFLDGLILLASEESPIVQDLTLAEGEGSMEMSLHELVDLKDSNNRLLVVISNIARFSTQDLPGMITQLEGILGISFNEEKRTLMAVIEELDDTLFERYTKPRVKVFKMLLRDSVLHGGVDWYNVSFPTAIRPQTFKILNYLVEVHAHLRTITPTLLEKILGGIILELVDEISRVFKQVPRFGMGGLLTALMDVVFLQKSLGSFGRDANIAKAFDDLINKQLKGPNEALMKGPRFEAAYLVVQRVIAAARSITSVHFLCFRLASEKEKPGLKSTKSSMSLKAPRDLQDRDSLDLT